MKHIALFFAILIVLCSCSTPEPVEFPDPNLAAAVREALGLSPDEPIMNNKLKELKDLTASQKGINDLTGLEQAKGLTTLSLSNNQISDLTPISGLKKLWWLGLDRNNISDITSLNR